MIEKKVHIEDLMKRSRLEEILAEVANKPIRSVVMTGAPGYEMTLSPDQKERLKTAIKLLRESGVQVIRELGRSF